MNKSEFLTDMDRKLRSVESYLDAAAVAPNASTVTKSLQQERAKPVIEALRERTAAARAQVDALRGNSASLVREVAAPRQAVLGEPASGPAKDRAWGATRTRLQQEWSAIAAALEQLEKMSGD